ncbi:MAG: hypothetical protein ACKVQB_02875 [Bacteroidia bacterium]
MNQENSKSLDNLIKNIKSQPHLIPIDGIENMSKGFFAAPKVWFHNWMKPAIAALASVFIIATSVFLINKNSRNDDETVKNNSSILKIDSTNTNITDTLEVTKSPNVSIIPPAHEFGNENNKKPDNNIFIANSPLEYVLTSADSSILNSLSAEEQIFKIDALHDTMIVGKFGTKVVFYKTCFEDMTGNVAKSDVNITLKECYNYPDMVKENLNTHWDSGYLESKGMIWLGANSNGKELQIREGFDCPIEFASSDVEDYNLYYSNTDKFSLTNWQLDSLGKVPNPVIVPNSGRYWDITFNYFMDNYKLNKSTMLELYEKGWGLHFTSTDTKMFGFTACTSASIYLNLACLKFRDLCADIYKEVPNIKHSSWVTDFGFSCISRDSLNRWLANDTIQQKVNKAIFGVNMKSPFFSSRVGWINCDHPIVRSPLMFNTSQNVTFTNYPKDGYTKTYLLLKKRKVIANPGGSNENPIFYNLPRNAEATLFSYKLVDGKISYFQVDVNTSNETIELGTYLPLASSDELVEKIDGLMNPKVN